MKFSESDLGFHQRYVILMAIAFEWYQSNWFRIELAQIAFCFVALHAIARFVIENCSVATVQHFTGAIYTRNVFRTRRLMRRHNFTVGRTYVIVRQ